MRLITAKPGNCMAKVVLPPPGGPRKRNCFLSGNLGVAVEAVVNGVPAFVDDIGSMALSVSNRSLSDIEKPWMPDRTQWANDLAYCQWTPQEMREGKAWNHLFR